MNVLIIYTLNKVTNEVDFYGNYPSLNIAEKNLNKSARSYARKILGKEDRKNYRIISQAKFDSESFNKDSQIPHNCLIFSKSPYGFKIFQKQPRKSMLSSWTEIASVGIIGIKEINVDHKCPVVRVTGPPPPPPLPIIASKLKKAVKKDERLNYMPELKKILAARAKEVEKPIVIKKRQPTIDDNPSLAFIGFLNESKSKLKKNNL